MCLFFMIKIRPFVPVTLQSMETIMPRDTIRKKGEIDILSGNEKKETMKKLTIAIMTKTNRSLISGSFDALNVTKNRHVMNINIDINKIKPITDISIMI